MGKKRPFKKKRLEYAVPEAWQPLLDLTSAIRDGENAANLLLVLYQDMLHREGLRPEVYDAIGYLAFALNDHMEAARDAYAALEAIELEVPHA